ncbi:MAG: hypothetical protein LBC70_10590 [Chitinispirillales bacterium]|jgi:hypothetical protein|nr:hypothetical protein [Chitinispirillales bacterium]
MNKPTSKKIRGVVNAAFSVAAAVMLMIAAAGCRDTNMLIKEELDEQLICAGGEAWGIVCAAPSAGQKCEPIATRAIAFNRDGTAIVYTATEASWSRYTQVRWSTMGNTLYITYSPDVGNVRYAFVFADGLLTLRAESSVDGALGYLTDGGLIAGYEKTRILPAPYPVAFVSGEGGTLSVTSAGVSIESGTEVPAGTVLTITATPLDGYALSTLTVNGEPFESGTTHTVNAMAVIAATFAAPVTFTAGEGGALSVTSDGDTITSGAMVPVGTVLTITATRLTGYVLSELTVNGEPFMSGATFVVDGAVDIAAAFFVPPHTVMLRASAGGTLSVTSADGPIESGTEVPAGTALTITATPFDRYTLSTLTVNGLPFESGETYTVNGPVVVAAVFAAPVTFTANAGGALSVTSVNGPITSGETVPVGTVLTVTAVPAINYFIATLTVNGERFVSGASFVVDSVTDIAATFSVPSHPVTLITNAGGTLSVTRNGVPITSGEEVPVGTVLTITATPLAGYNLTLAVNGQSVESGTTHTVEGEVEIVATFSNPDATDHPVTFTAGEGGTLSVTSPDGSITNGAEISVGTVLTITATPNAGFVLSTLTVNGLPFVSGATHTVNGSVVVSATFAAPVTFTASTGGLLSVTSASGQITSGSQVRAGTVLTITAAPNAGFVLSALTVNGLPFVNGATHTVIGPVAVAATFAAPVTFTAGTGGLLSVTSADGPITNGAMIPVGTDLTITATPSSDDYVLSTLTVNGQPFVNGTTHRVNGPVAVTATFAAPVTFTATLPGGSLSVTSAGSPITSGAMIPVGTVLTITAAPSDGYILSTLTVNGQALFGSGATHTVTGPAVIAATFSVPDAATYPVTFTANPPGGTLSVRLADNTLITSGAGVPAGTVLRVTAMPSDGHVLSTLNVNGLSVANGATHTVNGTVLIVATFTPGIPDAGQSPVNVIDTAGMTPEERARHARFLNGEGDAFGNSWWLDDGSRFEHDGISYANSAMLSPGGRFWQVAIPLDNSGNIDLNIPAKYLDVGTYTLVGNTIHIRIPELSAVGEDQNISRRFAVRDGSNGERVMEMWRADDESVFNIFEELRSVIFVRDPNITEAMLESGLDFDKL